MILRFVLIVGSIIILLALLASLVSADPIEDDGVWFPRSEAADLLSRAGEQATLQRTIEAQEKIIAAQERIIEIQARLVDLAEREAAAHDRLADLAGRERDVFKEKSERGTRWLKCQAYGATGALIGAAAGSVVPGPGTLAGGGLGAVAGCVGGLLFP